MILKEILKKIRHLEISANNRIDSLFSGNYRSAFKGRGIEFADIRPYDSGDDVRDIDWKTSSKQGEIFVKTYHESRDNTLFFVIDGGAGMQFSSQKQKKYERLLETFSLLAFSAVKNGDRVGIVFYGNGKEKIFPPKKGRKNVLQILKYCIEAYENFSSPLSVKKENPEKNLEKIFRKIFSFLRHSSTIFWLSSEAIELSSVLQKNIKILKTKHDFIPIIFPDPLEENFSQTGDFTFQDSFSGKISALTITPEIAENFKKIRHVKQKKFQNFFQHVKSQTLIFRVEDNIFKKLFLFFQSQ